ncbi:dihydrodipicolinate reductase C-terminal domain-containing protein [Acidovorax sp. FJL06]|uniref:dihydrodipicolinate reductase C-terminal domain-containing protein n=1 Tax=Acidovorax sp. FJL06 TaxID=2153365 RepID=UPI000F55E89B|nr:dihydrodipicolinate reductase C-terminal domain-containing protein [Acidovorax sp. FJL06]RQO82114.1 dihydrodipicolinate reductase [Acidovorax sp. FJL06]
MQVIVVGAGKLAQELLGALTVGDGAEGGAGVVVPWSDAVAHRAEKSIVVHAGSGRELAAAVAFCAATQSPLIELATGSDLEQMVPGFPVVVCPNTNILMLKFMGMLERSGHLFHNQRVRLIESHQAQKSSVPGTAVSMAQSLGLPVAEIESVRSADVQRTELQIPDAHLARHAYHQILVEDGLCSLKLETRVYGDAPYAQGVAQIVAAVQARVLECRCYSVMEFVHQGWL